MVIQITVRLDSNRSRAAIDFLDKAFEVLAYGTSWYSPLRYLNKENYTQNTEMLGLTASIKQMLKL
ncbi:hypothetical protein M514_03512 [Trichuris suis]|uniref:Uncharacterized protein n=1 Tax=Trichuris suis TaxID=68888 RepID=A0A085NDK3_9BILA|nr:hypothetical protein M513_03512 [Trichuris suis]KFD67549.1 hypothetical protein M514_03512 [Trichuris suis]